MKVKLLTGFGGPMRSYAPGDYADLPEEEARRLVAKGHAEYAEVMVAAVEPPQQRRGRGRPRKEQTAAVSAASGNNGD